MRFSHRHSLALLTTAVVAVGCTSIDSSDIRTNGIHPSMSVTSSSGGAGSSVSVSLHVGNSLTDFVELEGGDKLTVTAGEETKDLVEAKLLGAVSYGTDIGTQAAGTVVTIAFERTEADEDAPASTVTLTEPLTLTSPAPGGAASRATDAIVVTWTSGASTDPVAVGVSGECIQNVSRDVQAGETTVTLEAGSILKREPAEGQDPPPDSCDISVSVRRTHAGTVDPAFGGGSIHHTYSASAGLTSNP